MLSQGLFQALARALPLQMSILTSQLLRVEHDSTTPDGTLLAEVHRRLKRHYGTPTLGNFRDPVKEILYINLSARTNERLYKRAFAKLREQFPTLDELSGAKPRLVAKSIAIAGLSKKRSVQLIEIAKRLREDFSRRVAHNLRGMDAETAYKYLRSLPGVGPKSALCVMMYSLDFDVFPVDANIQRIAQRLGLIAHGLKHRHAQAILPTLVVDGISRSLHVGLIEHGRKTCLPVAQKCDSCVISDLCTYRTAKLRLP